MLAQPQETLDLQQRQSRAVAATCMAFPQPQSDINNFIVGSEEGTIYSGQFVQCKLNENCITKQFFSVQPVVMGLVLVLSIRMKVIKGQSVEWIATTL